MKTFPIAIDPEKVGEYPAATKSGGGFFYDEVLEYRVWCRPSLGAPDEFDGEIYYYAFSTFEEANEFSKTTKGSEKPLALVRQFEWINEPEKGRYIHNKGERITEWRVEWLEGGKRELSSIPEFIKNSQNV